MFYFIGLLILAAAIYVAFKSYTDTGFDVRKGLVALGALLAALLVSAGDWLGHFGK